jgi:uncharacterized protein YdaU (DUF1376 family)
MAEFPIMPVNVAMLLTDTSHMSSVEFGAYCRILFTMWTRGGRLPNDRKMLRKIAGINDPREWCRHEATIMAPLTISEGVVLQKRLSTTMFDVRELRAKLSEAGKKGNHNRWRKGGNVVRWPGDPGVKKP